MKPICVIGGGLNGLMAAFELKRLGHDVTVLSAGVSAEESCKVPLYRYMEKSPDVVDMVDRLGLLYETHPVHAGVLSRGIVSDARKKFSEGASRDHYRKTRLAEPPDDFSAVGDPEASSRNQAVSLDWAELASRLSNVVRVEHCRALRVNGLWVTTESSTRSFGAIVVAVPLWEAAKIFQALDVPDAISARLHLVSVQVLRDPFVKWDLVYTPYTPGGVVHRVHNRSGNGFACEFSGAMDEEKLRSDLNYLFPSGWHQSEPISSAHGHLLPFDGKFSWPKEIVPVGRHAAWDWRSTYAKTVKKAHALSRRLHAQP